MAWVVTVPNTFAESHIDKTATKTGTAAHKVAQTKTDKYAELTSTHIFYSFTIETSGTWDDMAIEFTQEIGRHITSITEDSRETIYLFQCFHGCTMRECSLLQKYHDPQETLALAFNLCLASIFLPTGFVLVGIKIMMMMIMIMAS